MSILELIHRNEPQMIGVMGTLLGTITGWCLNYLSSHKGAIEVYPVDFKEMKTSDERQYACISKLFLYNSSAKPNYIRDIQIEFRNSGAETIISKTPLVGINRFSDIESTGGTKIGVVNITGYTPQEIELSAWVRDDEVGNLADVENVVLTYKNHKEDIKELILKNGFDIKSAEDYQKLNFI